jgi:hypothetical protein
VRPTRLQPLAVAILAAAGCGGDGSAPGDARGGEVCAARELLVVNCSGCHDGASETTGFLDLTAADAVAALVGKPAAGPKCAASGAILINADGTGLFVDKLRAPPPCGDQMPQGTFPLSAEEISCVTSWVATVAASR